MTENGLCRIVAAALGIDENDVLDDTSMENCEKWDSLQHFTLILEVEKAYNVRFSSARISDLTSVRALSEEVTRLLK